MRGQQGVGWGRKRNPGCQHCLSLVFLTFLQSGLSDVKGGRGRVWVGGMGGRRLGDHKTKNET